MPQQAAIKFDPYSETFFNDPTALYEQLREQAPLFYDGSLDIWVVSRYEDVSEAFRDWTTFSSAKGITLSQVVNPAFDGTSTMMTMDPPTHDSLRALVSRVFTPKAVSSLEPTIRELAQSFLSPLEGRTEIDAFEDFAAPFPVKVICSMLGVPEDMRYQLRMWIDSMLHREPGVPEMTPQGLESAVNAGRYFYELSMERRANPTDDLISGLCAATITMDDGVEAQLDDQQVAGFSILLGGAGTETVAKLLASTLVTLEKHPEVREAVAADRSLMPALVDEGMRYHPPAQYVCRTTTREVDLPSGTLPADARVMLVLGAAMRDPRTFEDPEVFRLGRPRRTALGFGYGIHACLGTALARLEARIALDEFLDRWPDYTVHTDGLERVTQENTAGYCRVPMSVQRVTR